MKKVLLLVALTAMFFCGFSQNGNGVYNDSSVIIKNGKFGFINKSGKSTTPVEYTSILAYSVSYGRECGGTRGSFVVTTLDAPSFFEGSCSEFLGPEYGGMFYYSPIPGWVKKNGKWGFVTRNGKIILPFKYDLICGDLTMDRPAEFKMVSNENTYDSPFIVHQENGKWGVVAFDGEIIPHKYDEITGISETTSFEQGEEGETLSSMFSVNQNGKWGVIHSDGKQILPFKYNEIRPIGHTNYEYTFDNAFFVNQNGQWGVVAKQEQTGETGESKDIWRQILPCKYDEIRPIGHTEYGSYTFDNAFFVKQNDQWGVVAKQEQTVENSERKESWEQILPCKYDTSEIVYENGKWDVINPGGEEFLPCEYDDITELEDFIAGAGPGCGIGHLDFAVKQNGKWGIINSDDEEILPCKYDNLKKAYIAGPELIWCNKHVNCHVIVQQNNKWGVINPAGKQIIPCKYDEIFTQNEHFDISGYYPEQSFFKIKLNGKWGAITVQLNEEDYEFYWDNKNHIWADVICKQILPCEYEEIAIESSGYEPILKVRQNGKWGVVAKQTQYNEKTGESKEIWKQILPCEYEKIAIESSGYEPPILKVRQNGKWGVVAKQTQYNEKTGESKEIWKQVLPCKYDSSEIVYKNGHFLHKVNGKWGIIDSDGKEILPCKYDTSEIVYKNDCFYHKLNGKWGVINSDGKEILPCKYDTSEIVYKKGYLYHRLNGKWGVISSSGGEILPRKYDEIKPFEFNYINENNLFFVKQDGKCGLINSDGKEIIPCKYAPNDIWYNKISSEIYRLRAKDKFGIINSQGEILLPCEYDSISNFSNKYLLIKKSANYGLLTSEFNTYLPCEYQRITALNKGYLMLVKNGKYGVLTDNGKTILKCEFDSIATTNSNILMKQNGKWGAINAKGAIPCKYTEIVPVKNFYAVKDGKKWGIVGAAGNTILAPTYKLDKVEAFGNFFKVSYKKHFGLLDGSGKLVLPIAYEEITKRDGSSFFVKQKGKWGVADSKGKITVPCSHESTAGISR